MIRASFIVSCILAALPSLADNMNTSLGTVSVTEQVGGLDEPWAIAFLPNNAGVLITERSGDLLLASGNKTRKIGGVPKVKAAGQGGLLDVIVSRNFATNRRVYLTFSKAGKGGASTALMRAELNQAATKLINTKIIYEQANKSRSDRHYGSRVVEANDGSLFLTIGDRGDRDLAQDGSVANGSVIRVMLDGSIPSDNPKIKGALPEIYSMGHRNPQGAALDGNGRLWTVEHGPRGGDEINKPVAGRNYGWPTISYGVHYSGGKVGVGTTKDGLEQPKHYWDPSIAPSGMMIYQGDMFPEWQGDIFVGSLKFDFIARMDVQGDQVTAAENLFADEYPRIRDVREAPDGSIWFASVADGAIYRVSR